MYCTNCGNPIEASDRFCGNCGTPTDASSAAQTKPQAPDTAWQESGNFQTILSSPEVESLIEAASGQHPKSMSAKEFLNAAKPLLTAVGLSKVPLGLVLDVAPGLYSKIGINTGKVERHTFSAPIGRVIAAAMCSLASRNQPLTDGVQADDGCLVKAGVPSSMFVSGGEIVLTFAEVHEGTQVEIAVKIPGQLFDWGTSSGIVKNFIDDVPRFLRLQKS